MFLSVEIQIQLFLILINLIMFSSCMLILIWKFISHSHLILNVTHSANDKNSLLCSLLAIPAFSPHTSVLIKMVSTVLNRKENSYNVIHYPFDLKWLPNETVCCRSAERKKEKNPSSQKPL